MGLWLITHADGRREQIADKVAPPAPEGGSVVSVNRFGDLARERFDEGTRRWRKCPVLGEAAAEREQAAAQAWLDRLPPGVVGLLVAAVTEKLAKGGGAE